MAAMTRQAAHRLAVELGRSPPSTFKGFRLLTPEEVEERRQRLAAYEEVRQRHRGTRLTSAVGVAAESVQAATEEGEAADAGMAAVDEDSSSSRSSSSGSGSKADEPPPKRRRQPLLDEEVQLLTQLFPGRDGDC